LRAGPLSDGRIIDLLNRNFVCAYTVNADYLDPNPTVGSEERAELARIQQEGFAKKLSVGMVRVYVLTPDGHTCDIVPTQTSDVTLAALGQAVGHFKPQPGKPVVAPAPQSAPPPAPLGTVTLHLVSRGDDRGSWGEFPAENWIVLTPEEWSKLLPTREVTSGQTWELDRNVSARILTYFYPQTENNDARIDRLEQYGLSAKALTVANGVVTARVDGFVTMRHAFYPGRTDAQPLAAEVVGVLSFAPGKPPALALATTRAIHGSRHFKVAVQTVPQAPR
jgi:hypothetical protein